MPALQYGLDAYARGRGNLPELPVINMFAEQAPTEAVPLILQSRPGLADRSDPMGDGPVQALFQSNGVLNGTLYGVSGGRFFDRVTDKGAIAGTDPVSMAGFAGNLFVTAGTTLYKYDGATLSTVAFPDSADVKKVLVGASRLICIREDTETYYWSDVLSETIGALSFTSAESQPDQLRDALFIDDILILFGAETTEFHPNTSDPDLPFQALEGRVFEKGIRATGCATQIGSTFAWVANINQVCMSDPENIISKPWLEAKIGASDQVSLFTFAIEGLEFLCLRLDTQSWVYCLRSGLWSEFQSYGETNWLPQCHAAGVFGSSVDGTTMAWGDGYTDMGGVLERRFRGGFPLNSGSVTINNLLVRTNPGQTPYLTGDYVDPQIEMRQSRDGGQTWGNWKAKSLGAQGRYNQKVQWTGLGLARQPSFLAEFRVTDPVPFRVSGVAFNEPWGAY